MNRIFVCLPLVLASVFSYAQDKLEATAPETEKLESTKKEAEKPNPDWTISGAIDTVFGASSPSTGAGATRIGRQFDLRNDQLRLATAQVAIKYRGGKPGFGFTLTPFIGDNANILFSFDTSGSGIAKHVAEGLVNWQSPDGTTTVDFGKFYSFLGYESIESWNSDLYSRGLLFTNAQPNYHYGLRVARQASPKMGYSLFATNGWNQTERKTSGVAYGAQLRLNPTDKTAVTLGVLTGNEGSQQTNNIGSYGGVLYPTVGVRDTTLYDAIYTYQVSDKQKLALNANYAIAVGKAGASSGNWYGVSGISRTQLSDKTAIAYRVETMSDTDGLRFGVPCTVQSVAVCFDYSAGKNGIYRLELRTDNSNQAIFRRENGSNSTQNTLNLGWCYRF